VTTSITSVWPAYEQYEYGLNGKQSTTPSTPRDGWLGNAASRSLTSSLGAGRAGVNARCEISGMRPLVRSGLPFVLLLDLAEPIDQRVIRVRIDDDLLACLRLAELGPEERRRGILADPAGRGEPVRRERTVDGRAPTG
jgi:hypothetical protein